MTTPIPSSAIPPPSGMRLDYSLNVGTVVTILVLVVGGGAAWGKLQEQQAGDRSLLSQHEARMASIEAGARERELRLRALELGASRQDEKLIAILAAVARIEQRLEQGERP